MADNPLQFEWISTLKWGFEALFQDRPDVFVAGDHLIYPIEPAEGEEDSAVSIAPDVYIVFGRPKGYRGSYKVWEEQGIFPQVVFEVWSPSNRLQQMEDKRKDYEEYGAEEYYIVYPEHPSFVDGWVRQGNTFTRIQDIKQWTSPRLGIRFHLDKGTLAVLRPDGTKLPSYLELDEQLGNSRQQAAQEAKRAEQEAKRAESAEQRAARLAAKLRELGLDPDAG